MVSLDFYVDGSCQGNPGPGGFGVVAVDIDKDEVVWTDSYREANTTNNRMEMKAIIAVMANYGTKLLSPVNVYSDSAYCVNTFNDWMFKWADNGWLKADGNPPENLDLVKTYYGYYQKGYRINLLKIKGHAGHKYNEMADKLAKGEI